jgi:hypothetical protein
MAAVRTLKATTLLFLLSKTYSIKQLERTEVGSSKIPAMRL